MPIAHEPASRSLPIFMYHNIAEVPADLKRWRSLYVRPGAFARQLWLLDKLGFRGLSMRDAMPYLTGERQGKIAVITLDDGYLDNLEQAMPILARYGFTATSYVVSGQLGGFNSWDDDKLKVRKTLMNVAQLRQWAAAGMEVGAHTMSHPYLSQLSEAAQREEIRGSKAQLEDAIGQEVKQFCYPYGDHHDRTVELVRESGFQGATTTRRGRARVGMNLFRLPRVPVAHQHWLIQFAQRALTGYEDRRG